MAKIYSNELGKIIHVYKIREEEIQYGLPTEFASMIEFDNETNQAILSGLFSDINNYSLINGVLYHNDQIVTINPPGEEYQALYLAKVEYPQLPEWVKSGTASQAEAYLIEQIFSGQTQAQVEEWIDANITNITNANVTQINIRLASIRQGMKLIAGAIIMMRGLFILTSKLLIYIRDLIIRFRQ